VCVCVKWREVGEEGKRAREREGSEGGRELGRERACVHFAKNIKKTKTEKHIMTHH